MGWEDVNKEKALLREAAKSPWWKLTGVERIYDVNWRKTRQRDKMKLSLLSNQKRAWKFLC